MQVVGRILPAMYYKSIKSKGGRLGTIFITNIGFSITSRRQFYMLLSRRDVNFHLLCHVATCIFTSPREFVQASVTSRRCPARRDVIQ